MDENILIIMKEIIQPIFISILTAIITVKLALKKFRSEKWWEKKAETYSKIIDAIYQLKNYSEQKLAAEYREVVLSPEKETELRRQYELAHREFVRALDIGSFIIADDAVKILGNYQNRPKLNWNENPLFDIIEEDLKHIKICLHDFKLAAKKDLRIK